MKLKAVFAALSGGKRSSEKSTKRHGLEDENNSPLQPKRLLTPGLGPPNSVRRTQTLSDVTASGTPRTLNYAEASPPRASRLQREASLGLSRPSPSAAAKQAARMGSTPARTPARQPTRFGHQQQPQHDITAAAGAADAGALADNASDNIRVVLRVRPRNERESSLGGSVVVQPQASSTVRVASHPEPHTFSFDYVAGDGTGQETMFKVAGKPIVDNCLAGYNGCIFAYGQTGSGKTYTMLGVDDEGPGDSCGACTNAGSSTAGGPRDDSRGLIQRVFEHLFARIAQGGGKYLLECSFLEIYNETITDLLDPSRTNLQVRENLEGQYVSNLTAHEVYRVEDVVALLHTGQANRRVGETNMNERSSRSHSVFTCKLQIKTVDTYGTSHIRSSRLNLVDLAGSERQKASGAQGERLREATAINKSLSALGNVIMSLVDQQHGRTRHIPYRDSRLTYLLQDSLGGNAKTCLVATVSPAAVNVAETLSTLRFADQAKRIKNQAVVNEDTDGDRAALKREIKRLYEELAAVRRAQQQQLGAGGSGSNSMLVAEPGSGTPARLAAAADAMLGTSCGTGQEGVGRRQALMGALRREGAAAKEALQLKQELAAMRSLLKAKDSDLQRSHMMLKLKESRLARMQAGTPADTPTEIAELQQEVELLRSKVESHPEVKRFAVENLHLSEEVRKLESMVKRQELAALQSDVGCLRGEMLRMEDELKRCQDESSAAREAAKAALLEAQLAADGIRIKAAAEAEAKAAVEVSQLRQQLFQQQRLAQAQQEHLGATARENEELHARVALLQTTVVQLESTHSELKGELSPAKKRVRHFEQEVGLLRHENQAAELRASTEATMRSQAELSVAQLQQRVSALEGECAALLAANQDLVRANSDAEEQLGSAASVGAELAALRVQLDREKALAAQQQADREDVLSQLDASSQRVAALEREVQASQREAADAHADRQRQEEEHKATQAAAAARIADALQTAAGLQSQLEGRSAQLRELTVSQQTLQAKAHDLTQRCTQLHEDNLHLTRKLAQRDNELQEVEQTLDDKDAELEKRQVEAQRLAADLEATQAALEAKVGELSVAKAELESTQAKLGDATAAMQDAHEQLTELQERLAAADSQQAELEYELSDKSASLQEAREQVVQLEQQLAKAGQAQEEAAEALSTQATAQLEAAHQRAEQLATTLAELEGQLETVRQEAANTAQQVQHTQQQLDDREKQLADALAEAERQQKAAATAQQQASELAAQLQGVQQGTLLEKEQQILLGQAEVKELRQQLAQQEAAAEKLREQLKGKDSELATAQQNMAAEVSEAAQQVQLLLAAQARVAQLESELLEARQRAGEVRDREASQQPLKVAEAVVAAREAGRAELQRLEQQLDQRGEEVAALRRELDEMQEVAAEAATMTTAQAEGQIGQLIAEREAWIEEVQAQRAEATAAVEASRVLERRFAEIAEERSALAAALEEVQGRAEKLEEELTHLTGQQNLNQRIQYHKKIKDENGQLREELGKLRIEQHRTQVRYERMVQELQRLREAAGQEGLPDFDAEEVLRDALAATEQQKLQLERELEALAQGVLALTGTTQSGAADCASSGSADSAVGVAGRSMEEGDIVLEFGTPRPGRNNTSAAVLKARTAAAAARRALADITASQAATARSLEDQAQQIRLLKESSKLQRMRRTSALLAERQQQSQGQVA